MVMVCERRSVSGAGSRAHAEGEGWLGEDRHGGNAPRGRAGARRRIRLRDER